MSGFMLVTAPRIVCLCGGSGSGKSTIARRFLDRQQPGAVALVIEDDYYRDCDPALGDDPARWNFDAPDSKDADLLRAHLSALKQGTPIVGPRYCHTTHRRLATGHPLAPAPLVVIEGMHAPLLAAEALDLVVFLDTPDDIRLARRLLRDVAERGRTPAGVVAQYLSTVRPMHAAHVAPLRQHADVVLTPSPLGGDEDQLTAAFEAALQARGLLPAFDPPGLRS
jgi:uridine kinase